MKRISFTLLLSLSCCWLAAQCPTYITFSTQGQIDSFQINYPGCTEIDSNVIISGSDITNLQGLSALDSIHGCFLIEDNPLLTSLHGLENLSYVGKCQRFVPFNSKEWVGLRIENNAMLTSLHGLENIKSVKACVTVRGNPALTFLNGLDSLSEVGTCVVILGGSGDSYLTHSIGIEGNKSLKTIGGLANLDSLEILDISGNDSLLSLNGLENIRTVDRLYIGYNALLPNFKGLDSLQSAGSLYIEFNDGLQNFEGLEKLHNLHCHLNSFQEGHTSLHVESNFSLVDFSGLQNLQSIGSGGSCFMRILGNWSLQSLSGLGGSIDSLIELTIQNNPNLSICETPPICDYLAASSTAFISDNAPGCNSVAEVEAACIVSIEETSEGEPIVVFSPNPVGDFLQIQIKDSEKWEVGLFDLQGRQMFRQKISGSQIIEVKDWPSGIYTLRAVSGERVFSGKIVKQ